MLVGVSRTSKTPLSQYLAHKKIKVANIPLVPEVEPPEELYMVDSKKCFGLVISKEKLHSIRRERLLALGLRDDAIYATDQRIAVELEHFYQFHPQHSGACAGIPLPLRSAGSGRSGSGGKQFRRALKEKIMYCVFCGAKLADTERCWCVLLQFCQWLEQYQLFIPLRAFCQVVAKQYYKEGTKKLLNI